MNRQNKTRFYPREICQPVKPSHAAEDNAQPAAKIHQPEDLSRTSRKKHLPKPYDKNNPFIWKRRYMSKQMLVNALEPSDKRKIEYLLEYLDVLIRRRFS
jgi:hypothetical protein